MNNNSNKSIMAVALVAIALVFLVGSTTDNVMAKKQLTDQERYDSGYKDGIKDCGNENIIQNYMQTSAYVGHSDLYHQGYVDGAYNCGSNNNNDNNSQQPHFTKVSGQDNQNTNDNSNQNNRNQAQGQSSNQKVTCVTVFGNCNTTSGQAQNLQN